MHTLPYRLLHFQWTENKFVWIENCAIRRKGGKTIRHRAFIEIFWTILQKQILKLNNLED